MAYDADDPYHPGQRFIQTQVGEREVALHNGRNITPCIPDAARNFVAQQHYCLLGWPDCSDNLWASFLAGPQGFASTDASGARLELDLSDDVGVVSTIPPFEAASGGDPIGVLFIELASRRRLSVKGRVAVAGADLLRIEVERAFPLCPKYIQRRRLEDTGEGRLEAGIERGTGLSPIARQWIAEADTFFVASARPGLSADVSHRGGRSGFIHVDGDRLTVPDYSGNSMFNTLGNLRLNPRAGLAFVDFERNRQLQLSGHAELDLASADPEGATGGTGRWWHFHAEQWIAAPLNRAFAWSDSDESPFNP
jgi:predicted pyridoxine 5'-phosphate oxidase superfamily flavin-nucleotide-binding protein